jgi:hypothetical protein
MLRALNNWTNAGTLISKSEDKAKTTLVIINFHNHDSIYSIPLAKNRDVLL